MSSPKFCGNLPGIWSMVGDLLGRKVSHESNSSALNEDVVVISPHAHPTSDVMMSMDEKSKISSSTPPYMASSHCGDVGEMGMSEISTYNLDRPLYCQSFEGTDAFSDATQQHFHRGAFFSINSAGWFCPDSYICQKVWQTFKDMPRDRLRGLFFERQAQSTFGENFKNASAHNKGKHDPCLAESNTKKHPAQERQRRDRHRVFQRFADEGTPSSLLSLAQRIIGVVREELPLFFADDFESSGTTTAQQSNARNTRKMNSHKIENAKGKDEQLLSSAMFPSFAAIVVQSEIAHSRKLELALEESLKNERYLEQMLAEKDRIAWEREGLLERQTTQIQELHAQRNARELRVSRSSSSSSRSTPASSVSPRPSKRSLDAEYEIVASVESSAPKRRQTHLNLPTRCRTDHMSAMSLGD